MSAVDRTGRIRSLNSRNQPFHFTIFAIVPLKSSHRLQVQLAAVMPPLIMSSKTSRLQFDTIRPSKMIESLCSSAESETTQPPPFASAIDPLLRVAVVL